MDVDIEETLSRELREVAGGVRVPPLPALPEKTPTRRSWPPLLIAAAVVLIALATIVTVSALRGPGQVLPAPAPAPTQAPTTDPSATPDGSAGDEVIATTRPTVPYVLGSRLYVAGEPVPGEWAFVEGAETGWVAGRLDGSYWWGYDAEAKRFEGLMNQPPAISPNGVYEASIVDEGGQGLLTGADTLPAGEGFGLPVEIDLTDQDGVYTSVAAVTDDGLVITRGNGASVLWRPLVDGETVDLAQTAPDQVVLGSTPAGLVVVDGSGGAVDATQGEVYLAEISEAGELTRLEQLPNHDDLAASSQWIAWVPTGTLGGEVSTVDQLQVQRVEGSDRATLTPPEGRLFRVDSWAWEDDDHLLAAVVDDAGDERMARCSPVNGECVLIDAG